MARNQNEIQGTLDILEEAVKKLFSDADSCITESIQGKVSFKYVVKGPVPEFTPYERAQSLCFVTKYDSLPEPEAINVVEHKGRFYPNNIDSFRHLLNEYRPLIQNQSDSTYYSNVHALCRKKLANNQNSSGLSISVFDENEDDLTEKFLRAADQKKKAISRILQRCEFGYIYNGILQHSDHNFTERYIKDYSSGELHYIFIKHSLVCSYIKENLLWHHYMLKVLSGIRMGPM